MLEFKDVAIGYKNGKEEKRVLSHLSFGLEKGELLCILGANGVGKTTLYRTILGFLPILEGNIFIEGKNKKNYTRKELARQIAYVPQYHIPPFPYVVKDVVLMGRGIHISEFSKPSKKDIACVNQIMEKLGIYHLKDCVYTEISGGERQLVLIARALAQETSFLLMDEPASNLDYGNQMKLLEEMKALAKEGIGVCYSSHHPEHAMLNDSNILALLPNNQYKKGTCDILDSDLLYQMYGVDAEVLEVKHKKVIIPTK